MAVGFLLQERALEGFLHLWRALRCELEASARISVSHLGFRSLGG